MSKVTAELQRVETLQTFRASDTMSDYKVIRSVVSDFGTPGTAPEIEINCVCALSKAAPHRSCPHIEAVETLLQETRSRKAPNPDPEVKSQDGKTLDRDVKAAKEIKALKEALRESEKRFADLQAKSEDVRKEESRLHREADSRVGAARSQVIHEYESRIKTLVKKFESEIKAIKTDHAKTGADFERQLKNAAEELFEVTVSYDSKLQVLTEERDAVKQAYAEYVRKQELAEVEPFVDSRKFKAILWDAFEEWNRIQSKPVTVNRPVLPNIAESVSETSSPSDVPVSKQAEIKEVSKAEKPAAQRKFTEEQVAAMRAAHPKKSYTQIAAEYGAARSTVTKIIQGAYYK